ncbi:hypothetical protein BaRGS_00029128, partial [Batillaria attramentaria]
DTGVIYRLSKANRHSAYDSQQLCNHTPVPAEEESVQELTPTSVGDVGSDQGYASSSGSTLQTIPMLEDSNKRDS